MRILGIDPGISGAAALYCSETATSDCMFDFPTLGEGNKKELDYAELARLICAAKPDAAFIEQVNAFPAQKKNPETGEMEADPWGATSMFRFAGSYYALRAIVSCLGIPLRTLQASQWKAAFNLRGKKKGSGTDDSARQLVLQRYPSCAQFLKFKYHQHRAEAYLMGVYGARVWRREREDIDIPD